MRIGLVLAVGIVGSAWAGPAADVADPRIAYGRTEPNDAITRLQGRIDSGQFVLKFDTKRGYLPAVLDALKIPISSQMLVFSKTSVQKDSISPKTPRALYFNDEVYIGFLPGSKALEVAAVDPRLGPVYYVLLQKPLDRPQFFRATGACLECHATQSSGFVPENLVRSVYADQDGLPVPKSRTFATTDESPLEERWGGWYVTGRSGPAYHMGNRLAVRGVRGAALAPGSGAGIADRVRGIDVAQYPSSHSDIVALMVLAHQAHLQNLITRACYRIDASQPARQDAKPEYQDRKSASTEPAADPPGEVKEVCEPIVKALLLSREARLDSRIAGTSGFAEQFGARGPFDRKHRSLRQLDLRHRLFRYPCSFTIYSAAFDALPAAARNYIYHRLYNILNGRDTGADFPRLGRRDRTAILQILMDTKADFARWLNGAGHSTRIRQGGAAYRRPPVGSTAPITEVFGG